MKNLSIYLENCYGIGKLEYEFEFKENQNNNDTAKMIYARNGVMKSSFTKVFKDISNNNESSDPANPELQTVREIRIDSSPANPERIFVVESMDDNYEAKEISTLLISQKLKKEYINLTSNINDSIALLLKSVKKQINLKDFEEEINKVFNSTSIVAMLKNNIGLIKESSDYNFKGYTYSQLFSKEIINLFKDNEVRQLIEEYFNYYAELVQKSSYLNDTFNHNSVDNIQKNLDKNGFFSAGHALIIKQKQFVQSDLLHTGSINSIEINDSKQLAKLIELEMKEILGDKNLEDIFRKIDEKLNQYQNLKGFRSLILSDRNLLLEYGDIVHFQKRYIGSAFSKSIQLVDDILLEHDKNSGLINELMERAKKETTIWEETILKFKSRFDVPFGMEVTNKSDIIMDIEKPEIVFTFEDERSKVEYTSQNDLRKVLSTGQKRALYLLNILFEIESRKLMADTGEEFLLIIDDVVDSFDYHNKYAIIEYLKEVTEQKNFYMLMLTHNFDFYRIFTDRVIVLKKGKNTLFFAYRNEEQIKIEPIKYNDLNPFKQWKSTLGNSTTKLKYKINLLAFAPLIREISGYLDKINEQTMIKDFLNIGLHYKEESEQIFFNDYFEKCSNLIKIQGKKSSVIKANEGKTLFEVYFEIADELTKDSYSKLSNLALEEKVVLSISLRLKAEMYIKYMFLRRDPNCTFDDDRIGSLFSSYKKEFPNDNVYKTIESIVILTPENIHLNSFVFEPLMDVPSFDMKELYKEFERLTEGLDLRVYKKKIN